MKCTLMHKRIAVAEMEVDDAAGLIQRLVRSMRRIIFLWESQ